MFLTSIAWAQEGPKVPKEVQISHIDMTWLGMLMGAVPTGIVVAVVFLLIGWLLIKYGVVHVGTPVPIAVVPNGEEGKDHRFVISPEVCTNCAAERLLSSQHENQITELFHKWNSVKDSMSKIAVDIGIIQTDVGNIKRGVSDLQSRRGGR
jgi:hypothetical protein